MQPRLRVGQFQSGEGVSFTPARAPQRSRATGLLLVHNRTPRYEWIWDRFAVAYMVTDGLYRLSRSLGLVKKAPRHAARIATMCDGYGIPTNAEMIDRIVGLRNGLFHEAWFDDSAPGSSGHGTAFIPTLRLGDLNRRALAALLGWDVPFVHSPWWLLDRVPFDW